LYEGALSQERACDKFRKIIAYIKVVRLMKKTRIEAQKTAKKQL
jgi:hypothetical protein